MTLELLSKSQLQIINRNNLRYPLDAAEKDYFLALVSKTIYESPIKEELVFKGGTALHHTYLPQLRFSEDLDFTALSAITLEELASVLATHDFLQLKEHFVSESTLKINRLKYVGSLGNPNSLGEVDMSIHRWPKTSFSASPMALRCQVLEDKDLAERGGFEPPTPVLPV